jgi:hypothetical protein
VLSKPTVTPRLPFRTNGMDQRFESGVALIGERLPTQRNGALPDGFMT